MTGITKLEASILWGNGFKLKDKEGNEWDIVRVSPDWIDVSRFEGGVYEQVVFYSQIGIDYFIICHSLDKLTQPIMHEGKEIVPIVELAKMHLPFVEWRLSETVAVSKSMRHIFSFNNKKTTFCLHYRLNMVNVPNQPALFAYMDSRHFDRFGWQERGLTTPKTC